MTIQEFDAFETNVSVSEPFAPSAVLGESITIIGSPDALPGITPLLAYDDILQPQGFHPFVFSLLILVEEHVSLVCAHCRGNIVGATKLCNFCKPRSRDTR